MLRDRPGRSSISHRAFLDLGWPCGSSRKACPEPAEGLGCSALYAPSGAPRGQGAKGASLEPVGRPRAFTYATASCASQAAHGLR